jgi:VanZ family protein
MIFILSVYPVKSEMAAGGFADKALHAVIYAITCLLFYSTLRDRAGRWALLLSVLLASGYGFLMEVAQKLTGYRHFSGYDALANFAGAAAAALYVWTGKSYKWGRDK